MNTILKDINLLLVDDEKELIDLLSFIIKAHGATVDVATNVNEAIENIKSRKYDVILSDLQMPGGDGMQILNFILKNNLENPLFYFMSGFSKQEQECLSNKNVTGYFKKPFKVEMICETIAKNLKKSA